MLTLRLPDGSSKQYPEGTRPRDVAESIGKRLAQAAVAAPNRPSAASQHVPARYCTPAGIGDG